MKASLLAFLGVLIYRALAWTWRIRVVENSALLRCLEENRCVFAHWHGDELALLSLVSRYRICAMVSTSKDGSIMTSVVEHLGGATSRGSSTRGGAQALRGLLRIVKMGFRPSVAVDGPKGPIHQVKPGVCELSRILSAPIFPIGVAVDRAWHFPRSWNKTFLPKPFATVVFVWGPDLGPVNKEQDPRDLEMLQLLRDQILSAGREAQNLLRSIGKMP